MVKWGPDSTKRFNERPFYTHDYIENVALEAAKEAAKNAELTLQWPITNDFLELLIESVTEEFDPYADLSRLEMDVDGYTVFSRRSMPSVLINKDLAEKRYENRRRMTIAHELGHVLLHQPLYKNNQQQMELLVPQPLVPVYCTKKQIIKSADWCEWQAGFFAGALLTPKSEVVAVLLDEDESLVQGLQEGGIGALRACNIVARNFQVSKDAARVRLAQVGLIKPLAMQPLGVQTA